MRRRQPHPTPNQTAAAWGVRAAAASLAWTALAATASADEAPASTAKARANDSVTLGIGARIGGYGFRQATNDDTTNWEQCRMNGVGIFGTVDLTDHVFTELSIDGYYATGDVVNQGIDRVSLHAFGALGLRMFPHSLISPHIQLGGGAEWTRVELTDADQLTDGWYPAGFIGTGGELNLGDHLKLGLNLRVFAMALPVYDYATYNVAEADTSRGAPGGDDDIPMEFEMASQLQFFLRYAM